MSNAYCRIKGASWYFIDTNVVQLPNHNWTQPGSLSNQCFSSSLGSFGPQGLAGERLIVGKKFSVGWLHMTPGPNSERHNLINQPAAPCLLNTNERCPIRRTICIWALPAEAALAGVSVLMQPNSRFLFSFSPSLRWNQSQTEKRNYNERLLLWITWRPCRIQKNVVFCIKKEKKTKRKSNNKRYVYNENK